MTLTNAAEQGTNGGFAKKRGTKGSILQSASGSPRAGAILGVSAGAGAKTLLR